MEGVSELFRIELLDKYASLTKFHKAMGVYSIRILLYLRNPTVFNGF